MVNLCYYLWEEGSGCTFPHKVSYPINGTELVTR